MKKIIGLILAVVLTLGFAGCTENNANVESEKIKIGLLQFADHPSLDNIRAGILEGLKEAGFDESKVEIEYQNSQAETAIANTIAQNFVAKKMDLICAIATPAAQAAANAAETAGIPVIFSAITDPVASELVITNENPGKNATGTSDVLPAEKQLKMIKAFVPDVQKIGILYSTNEVNSESSINDLKAVAPSEGIEIVAMGVSNQADLPMAIDTILTRVDAIVNVMDNLVVSNLSVLLDKATAQKIPVFGSEEEQVKNGCVASEGIDYITLGKKTSEMIIEVLGGKEVGTLPVVVFTNSIPTINKNAVEAFGLTLPDIYKDNVNFVN